MCTRLTLSRQKRWVRMGTIFVLLLVLLPNVAYVGHWSPSGQIADAHSLHAEHRETEHAAHCHEGPSQCNDTSVIVRNWRVGDDPTPISTAKPRLTLQSDENANAVEPHSSRILRPPQFA